MPNLFPIQSEPEPRDLDFLEERIIAFNYQATGFSDGQRLAIFVRDAQDEILAGISGFTWGGACKIELLWVREDQRRHGLGRDLMLQAEAEAVRRGCIVMLLDTHSFQAPGFYQKLGFAVVGAYQDYPQGHRQPFLQKQL